MATVETGLGWYADSAWLADQTAAIGSITPSGGSGEGNVGMIPSGITPDMTSAREYGTAYGIRRGITYYVAGAEGDGPMFVGHVSGGLNRPYVAGTVLNQSVYQPRDIWGMFYLQNRADNGLYWNIGWGSDVETLLVEDFATLDAFLAAALAALTPVTPTNFTKSTAGYSIVCLCKWKTEIGGDVYCSPVLISSEQNNTLYTRNGSTPSVDTTEHTFQGMTFYMRKAPLDILDGTETVTANFPVLDYSSSLPITNNALFALIASASGLGVGYPPQSEDPYGPGGTSGPGGGDPNFDDSSDTIDDSPLPTFSFAATGFSRIYNPTLSELNSLASYMWTDQTFLQTVINHLKQLLENPMDAVISLSRVPVPVPQGTSEEVKVMYIPTGVYMAPATTQFVDVDCGSLLIDKRYDSALDFNPYTKVSLFLPFVGMVNLDTDEVMEQTIFVKYRVDIVSGACVAKVFVGDTNDSSCLYQYSGDCSMAMPINSADFSGYKAAVISAAKVVSLGVAAAGSAITAAAAAEGFKTATSGGAELTFTEEQKSQYEKAMSNISSTIKNSPEKASFEDAAKKQASNTVGSVIGSKVEVEHSGGFSGNTGVLGIRRPYVVIKRPRMCNPEQYGQYNGRPCQMYLDLATLHGYTEIQAIQLTGFSATNPELAEIASLLKGGVIL